MQKQQKKTNTRTTIAARATAKKHAPARTQKRSLAVKSKKTRRAAPTTTSKLSLSTTAKPSTTSETPKILITGAGGQVGFEITTALRKMYGKDNVIATDVRKKTPGYPEGPFRYLDVMDAAEINELVVDHNVTWVCHLASILSAAGEKNPALAMKLNTRGIENVLETARMHNLRVFAPSTIAAFGPNTPPDNTPDATIMQPTTMYGVTKVYLELLGNYYKEKYNVDFRSMRYPGVISSAAPPGGGTTDWLVDIYHQALTTGHYTCFLREDSALPMMSGQDCVDATLQLLTADVSKLTQTTYNVTGCSVTPKQAAESIRKYIPHFTIDYAPDFRQAIADSWPNSLDDSIARKDWGWKPTHDLDGMTRDMLGALKVQYNIPDSQFKLPPM
jgi:threonine 3-dehydrogenase